jgi:hypothetical protein
MAGIPRVFASGKQIAALRDTNVYLLTVELWSGNQVTVRLVGQLNERMQSAIDSYYVALQGWTPDQSRDAVPSSPGEEMFRALRVGLSDEVGTAVTRGRERSHAYCLDLDHRALPGDDLRPSKLAVPTLRAVD